MYSSKGISIIICCHNSSKLLPETIRHICNIGTKTGINIEAIVIDNNSSDATSEEAEKLFKDFNCSFPYKIIHEPVQGLSYARRRGLENADYEYLIYCDDDNWLDRDYAELSFNIMESNKEVAALGGRGEAVTDGKFPEWFESYSRHYSAGSQASEAGDVTWTTGYIWGAGMVLRKSALLNLYENGFTSMLSDRSGGELSSGGDVELCYALKLAGWKIRYEPSLKFRHFIPKEKLEWGYLRRLNRGFGSQKVIFAPYLLSMSLQNGNYEKQRSWKSESLRLIRKIRSYGFRKLLSFARTNEGDADILRIEKSIGRLTGLLRLRKQYELHIESVRNAKWKKLSEQ